MEIEDYSCCYDRVLFLVDEGDLTSHRDADSGDELYLEVVGLLGFDSELFFTQKDKVIRPLVLGDVVHGLRRGVGELDCSDHLFSQDATEFYWCGMWGVVREVVVEMNEEKEHLSLEWVVDVFGDDMTTESYILQSTADLLSVMLEIVIKNTGVLQCFQHPRTSVLLQQNSDHYPILKVLLEIGYSPLLQQDLSNVRLYPMQYDPLAGRQEIRPVKIPFRNVRELLPLIGV